MRHLEGFSLSAKSTQADSVDACYERAIFDSELSVQDQMDMAKSYLDYLRETAPSAAHLKLTEARIREAGLFETPTTVDKEHIRAGMLGKRPRLE